MTVAYDGAGYSGWQVQPDRPTVQGELEAALARLCRAPVRLTGAGRTDAGVHALGQVAHFDDPFDGDPERLRRRLNSLLPPQVRVLALDRARPGFHALRDARDKTYVYQLHLSADRTGARAAAAEMPPHRRLTFHAVRGDLDREAMRRAAALLVGRRDFTAVSKTMEAGRGTVKTLSALRVLSIPRGLRIVATADGFLYGMVRMLSGLLVEVGRGRLAVDGVPALIRGADRSRAPPSLPAHALFLWRVRYGDRSCPRSGHGVLLSWTREVHLSCPHGEALPSRTTPAPAAGRPA
jgi:tRNA pseudouridine38-40 synthase